MTTSSTISCPAKAKPKVGEKKRYAMRRRANSLRRKGMNTREVAGELGVDVTELRELEARRSKPKPDQFSGKAWNGFLESITEWREEDPRLVGGEVLAESASRAYYRWTEEGVQPSFFSADRFLTQIGMHVEHFFEYCEDHETEAWACGEPPEWMRKPAMA
jgi:hypothetical protein